MAPHLLGCSVCRTSATASTWSLARLDALAAEVVDTLTAQNPQLAAEDSHTPASAFRDLSNPSRAAFKAIEGSPARAATANATSELSAQPFRASTAVQDYAQHFPMQVLTAVNSVLFGRHGYSACNRYGTATDSHLSAVLESGPGSCAALTVLYLEVCSRLGLSLGFKVLDEGRYCLVWPRSGEQQQLLMAAGEACVVDVYGKGALLTVKEVSDLFDISEEDLFAGSSRRSLLAALLAEQQHAHWCRAVGCSPQPAFMTQLSAATAVNRKVKQLNGLSIERATAAARKRVSLLPGDMGIQLQLALLCYFSGRYGDAWLELGSYIEAVRQLQRAAGVHSSHGGDSHDSSRVAAGSSKPDPVSAATAAAASLTGAQIITPAAAAAVTAAAATVASESEADEMQEGELADVLLLFEKLQLELMMGGGSA
eukprot:GHUV01018527.1.p1 GENE.GHUV01018527.1~~GHUV01018527.1.p1  ORF type:complete len:426 (+),score=190.14 GHUV01018527.1:1236-2513(+)